MGSYAAYPMYKDSGFGWLGQVPAEWEVKRLKYSVSLVNEKVDAAATDLDYMGLEHIESWTGRRLEDETASSDGTAARFQPGDVLFGKLRPYLAKVYLCRHEGLASTEALVLRSRGKTEPSYLRYYIVSRDFINAVDASTYGAKMPRASWDFIGNLPLLVPKYREQQAIVHFLDYETAQIDELIKKQQLLLSGLQEKRQALIHHVVTKGLDSASPLQDTGVSWLGEIPYHWKHSRFGYLLVRIETGWTPDSIQRLASDDEWAVLKVGCVRDGKFFENEHKALAPGVEPINGLEVHAGDLIMSRANTTELVGSVGLIRQTRSRLTLCDKTFRLVLKENLLPEFANYVLGARVTRNQIELAATGASPSMKNISQESVKGLWIPLPPVPEQQQIVEFLDKETAQIETLTLVTYHFDSRKGSEAEREGVAQT